MADIGILKVTEDRGAETLAKGSMTTLDVFLFLQIEPDPESASRGDKAPTHKVLAKKTNDGHVANIGAAWARPLKRGGHEGRTMFSISLTDPALPEWCGNLAAFPTADPGVYNIVHERKRQDAA